MTVVVSFITPAGRGYSTGVGTCRVRENLTPPATTTETVKEGEMIVVGNAESSMVAVAFGTTPDAAATAATAATSAGVPVPAGGLSYPFEPKPGDKINVKAVA